MYLCCMSVCDCMCLCVHTRNQFIALKDCEILLKSLNKILKGRSNQRELLVPDIKMYYKATEIETVYSDKEE